MNFTTTNGLTYLRCRQPSEDELSTLPYIIVTSNIDWDPSIYDQNVEDVEEFYDSNEDDVYHSLYDEYREYRHRTVANSDTDCELHLFDPKD